MQRTFDAIVIGSGSAGTQAAFTLREAGRSVAVIEEGPFGGTCALRGCDPKKVLVNAARVVDAAQRLAGVNVVENVPRISWRDLIAFKRTFTQPVPSERLESYSKAGITSLYGHARFEDDQTLRVDAERIRAQHIVIASGAHELHVADGDTLLLTSETFMELEELPRSLIFVGGGYIAFEFAHVAARAGAQVTILNNDDRPLSGFDRDAVQRLLEITRSIGIAVHLNTTVTAIERDAGGIVAHAMQNGKPCSFRAENGVLAAGRVPALEHLALERANIERTKKGVKVDAFMQSSNVRVYAAGDAADAGAVPLTPVAAYTGKLAAQNILAGNTHTADFSGLATMVYTIPPLGSVGMSEAKAREAGIEIEVHAGDMTDWYSTRHVAGRGAYYKTITEKQSGKMLGATVLGPHAEEQINMFALAMRYSLDAHALADALFAYPTGASDAEYLIG